MRVRACERARKWVGAHARRWVGAHAPCEWIFCFVLTLTNRTGPDLAEATQRLDEARLRERGEDRPLSRAVRLGLAWLGLAPLRRTKLGGTKGRSVVLSLCWQGSQCVRRRRTPRWRQTRRGLDHIRAGLPA